MNEIVKEEIEIYEMMKEYKQHKELDRAVAKEVLHMELEFNKKLNNYIKFNEAQRYLLECYKKLSSKKINKKISNEDKEIQFVKLIKELDSTGQDALYELEKLVYKPENKKKMTDTEKDLLKTLLKYSM